MSNGIELSWKQIKAAIHTPQNSMSEIVKHAAKWCRGLVLYSSKFST